MKVPAGEMAHYSFPDTGSPETAQTPTLPPAVIAMLSAEKTGKPPALPFSNHYFVVASAFCIVFRYFKE
jgi:hypothetical protein